MILHYIIVIKFKKDNVSAVLIDKIGYYDLNRCTKIKFVKKLESDKLKLFALKKHLFMKTYSGHAEFKQNYKNT